MFGFGRKRIAPGATLADRSSATVQQSVNRALDFPTNHNPALNQAESGRVNRPISARPLYAHLMGPVVMPPMFDGFVGMFHARVARVQPVITAPGYDGIMPIREQSTLDKPLPYK
jgi:hypothetical protein